VGVGFNRIGKDGLSGKLYGAGGIIPRSPNVPRGAGIGGSPMFHYSGTDIRNTLNGLRDIDSTPWDAVTVDFTNPQTGDAVFATLGYTATLLKPGEETAESRSTAGTFFTAIAGTGYTEVAGQKLEWGKNDLFVIPNHTWYRHVNTGGTDDAILYGISDRPLLEKIGHYRRQGRDESGTVLDI
jgi:gentisate 1,2-dioxygenase